MSNTETVNSLFEYAIGFERTMEEIYSGLERMFANCPDIALFWKHYANEEKGHAAYLERIREGVNISHLSQKMDGEMFKVAKQYLDKTSQAGLENIHTLEDAFQLATELENSETNAVFEFMIENFSTDELAKSHRFLRTQLNTHIARLEQDFPTPYKSKIARMNVIALK